MEKKVYSAGTVPSSKPYLPDAQSPVPVEAWRQADGSYVLKADDDVVGTGSDDGGGGGSSSPSSEHVFSTLWKNANILSGVYRMNPNYTGPLLELRSELTNEIRDFYDVSSEAGRREVEAFAAGYGLRVRTVYSQVRGNHQSQDTAALQPAFTYQAGRPVIAVRSYDGQDRRLHHPAGLVFDKRSTSIIYFAAIQTGMQPQQIWELGVTGASCMTPSLSPATDMNVQLKEDGVIRSIGFGTKSMPGSMTPEMIAWRFGADAVRYNVSHDSMNTATGAPCAAGTYNQGFSLGAHQNFPGYSFHAEMWAYFPTSLSDAELQELQEDLYYLGACRGKHTLVMVGDSITEGIVKDKPGINYGNSLRKYLHKDTLVRVMGKSGQQLTEMNTNYSGWYDGFVQSGRINVIMLMGGINDFMVGNASSATVIAAATAFCTKARASGYKVVLCTVLPAINAAIDATDQSNRTAYNTWVMNTAVQNNIADGALDLAALPPFLSAANLRYMPDSLHPSGLAYRVAAPYIAQYLEQFGFLRAGDSTLTDF